MAAVGSSSAPGYLPMLLAIFRTSSGSSGGLHRCSFSSNSADSIASGLNPRARITPADRASASLRLPSGIGS